MKLDFFNFHKKCQEFMWHIPADPTEWPAAWSTKVYKRYSRSTKVVLEVPQETSMSSTVFHDRKSTHAFKADEDISFKDFSSILYWSCAEYVRNGLAQRPYPSAGGLYPVETYVVLARNISWADAGVYHYDYDEHSLSLIHKRSLDTFSNKSHNLNPAAYIFLTGVFNRAVNKYSDRGYQFTLLEAGHIAQNIYLTSALNEVGVTEWGADVAELADFDFLEIDGISESLITSLLLGVPKD